MIGSIIAIALSYTISFGLPLLMLVLIVRSIQYEHRTIRYTQLYRSAIIHNSIYISILGIMSVLQSMLKTIRITSYNTFWFSHIIHELLYALFPFAAIFCHQSFLAIKELKLDDSALACENVSQAGDIAARIEQRRMDAGTVMIQGTKTAPLDKSSTNN